MWGSNASAKSGLPDKDHLYGNYERSLKWQDDLHRKAAHKALDMAEEMGFEQNLTRTGFGWKELAVVAGAVLGGIGLVSHFSGQNDAPPQQQAPVDSDYDVRFYDADGNPIHVPHISERQ